MKLVSCGRKADLLVNSVSAGPSTHSTTAGSHPPTCASTCCSAIGSLGIWTEAAEHSSNPRPGQDRQFIIQAQ